MSGVSASDMPAFESGSSASSAVSANNNNYISSILASGKRLAQPACTKWNALSSSHRTMATIIGVPLLLLPLIWTLIISPWIIVGGLALYAIMFGPRTMVSHLEAALREQLHVPDQAMVKTLQKVHENADKIKGQADKMGTNLLDIVYWLLYTVTVYMLKAIELVITKLQSLSRILRSKEVSTKEQIASRKKISKKAL